MAAALRSEFNLQNVYMVSPAVKLITFVSRFAGYTLMLTMIAKAL